MPEIDKDPVMDYVFIDKAGRESVERSNSTGSSNPEADCITLTYMLEVTALVIIVIAAFYLLMRQNDIAALWLEFLMLLVLIILSLDKVPGLRLNLRQYLSGPIIQAVLEETVERPRSGYLKRPKKAIVVKYHAVDLDDRPVAIRKSLKAGLFDKGFTSEDAEVLTELSMMEGNPFSAYPKAVILAHRRRYQTWRKYIVPLIATVCVMIFVNVIFTATVMRGAHRRDLKAVLIFYAFFYPLVALPIAFKIRRWKIDVGYGGEECSTISYT